MVNHPLTGCFSEGATFGALRAIVVFAETERRLESKVVPTD